MKEKMKRNKGREEGIGLRQSAQDNLFWKKIKIKISFSWSIKQRKLNKVTVKSYQVAEACQTNFFQCWKWPPSYEVPIKIVKESWKPSHHDFMIQPPFHELP